MRETVTEVDGSIVEYDFFEPTEDRVVALFRELFERHWGEVRFGPCLQGAVYELALERPPRLSMLDGYLTVDAGAWHVHFCLGTHRGAEEAARRVRRVARIAFFRSRNVSCVSESFGLRLWNGAGEQMVTVFFPNPWLDERQHRRRDPDPSRLVLWKELRAAYAGVS